MTTPTIPGAASELLPCPFCWQEAGRIGATSPNSERWCVSCFACSATLAGPFESKEAATVAWNTRTPAPAPEGAQREAVAPEIPNWFPDDCCQVCGWTLAASREQGCVVGDCSYRPREGTEEYARIQRRRDALARRKQSAPPPPDRVQPERVEAAVCPICGGGVVGQPLCLCPRAPATPTDASGGVTEEMVNAAYVAPLKGGRETVVSDYIVTSDEATLEEIIRTALEAADRARKPDARSSAGEPVAHVPNAEFCPHCNPCRNAIKFAEAERYAEDADSVLRGLMLYLSAGGAHGVYWIDTKQADKAIRWGIDHMLKCEFNRGQALAKLAAPTDGRSPNDVPYREVTLEDVRDYLEHFKIGGARDVLAAIRSINAVILDRAEK